MKLWTERLADVFVHIAHTAQSIDRSITPYKHISKNICLYSGNLYEKCFFLMKIMSRLGIMWRSPCLNTPSLFFCLCVHCGKLLLLVFLFVSVTCVCVCVYTCSRGTWTDFSSISGSRFDKPFSDGMDWQFVRKRVMGGLSWWPLTSIISHSLSYKLITGLAAFSSEKALLDTSSNEDSLIHFLTIIIFAISPHH